MEPEDFRIQFGSDESLVLTIFDNQVSVILPTETADDLRDKIHNDWSRCLASNFEAVGESFQVHFSESIQPENMFQQLTSGLTSYITNLALEKADHENYFLLHAAAVADTESGAVWGFVGQSGAGKTTLAQQLCSHFGYVSDETLAFNLRTAEVSAYPKPLSILPKHGVKKNQFGPDELQLIVAPHKLHLERIFLMNRNLGGNAKPRLESVSWLEAVQFLIPQVSFLALKSTPLEDLMACIGWNGGVLRLTYSEASDVSDWLQSTDFYEQLNALPETRFRATSAPEITATQDKFARPSGWLVAKNPEHHLIVDDSLLTMIDQNVTLFSELATVVWLHSVEPRLESELLSFAAKHFVIAEADKEEFQIAFREAVGELLKNGLLNASNF